MALTDAQIRGAKPKSDRAYKLYDEYGLFIHISLSGAKLWRFRFQYAGKEKTLSLGAYPAIGVREARHNRDEARRLLAAGKDPSAERKRQKIATSLAARNTFEAVAEELIDKNEKEGMAEVTLSKQRWIVSLLAPSIGDRPISDLEPLEVLNALKQIEKGARYETTQRARSLASRIFRYAIITGRARHNAAADLGMALISHKPKHHAAIIDPDALGALLRAIEDFEAGTSVMFGLRLLPHVFVRPGELRHAEWREFDFEKAIWRIPAGRMKMRDEHVVPLSRQSIAILQEARYYHINGPLVFPSVRTWMRPMSENTLTAALRRMGYSGDEMTAHGFRSTASTLLNESGLWSPDTIERALAHKDANTVRGIYHRGTHWKERVEMAQWWSDHLDELRLTAGLKRGEGSNVARQATPFLTSSTLSGRQQ
ncbi:tyrosine-type recombinase/integrase [Asticcacaulis endophyticus]|uniref:Integrase n=1 Tax=Asticcacaulis endophyticus TaxID=1395890 RepID=A0A918Q2S3_9CAUL|nr:integrase arm-type DNA-binding domain-containing protein [Asticcacaulis endophyticus]GGZ30408.1 integrase [Asticcacaulis endophyticus]